MFGGTIPPALFHIEALAVKTSNAVHELRTKHPAVLRIDSALTSYGFLTPWFERKKNRTLTSVVGLQQQSVEIDKNCPGSQATETALSVILLWTSQETIHKMADTRSAQERVWSQGRTSTAQQQPQTASITCTSISRGVEHITPAAWPSKTPGSRAAPPSPADFQGKN